MKNIIWIYLLWPYAGASGFTQTLPTENSVRTSRLRVQQQPSSKITLASDNELLLSSFNNLREDEKYDTVLTGLCSKILDDPNKADYIANGAVSNFAKLEEPLKLLVEMNSRNVPVTYRACSALLDVAGSCEDVQVMSTVMTLLRRNRDSPINNYGQRQRDLTQYPTNQPKKQQRLSNVPKIPTDDRASEISSALSVLSVAAACFLADPLAKLFGGTDAGPLPNLVLFGIISVGVLDNFYDVLSGTANLVDKAPKMPEKGNLPLGLGNGQLTSNFVAGFNRLFTEDTERACEAEAAAFLAAYSLGLPCFAFQPNALEAAILAIESSQQPATDDPNINYLPPNSTNLDPLLSNEGVIKLLIWLYAPVAYENSKHPQLLYSDPREAASFLDRIRNKLSSSNIGHSVAIDEADDLMKWAYAEADMLQRQDNGQKLQALSEGLASGASTLGDIVGIIEGW